jgi:hypothetical protein
MSDTAKAPADDDIARTASIAGVPVSSEVAQRIAASIGPAFVGFAPILGTLPFDLEPATFVSVQNKTAK